MYLSCPGNLVTHNNGWFFCDEPWIQDQGPMTVIVCEGDMYTSSRGTPRCNGKWVQQAPSMSIDQVDPALMAGAVGAGFFLLVPLWAACIGGKKLLKAIQ